MIFASPAPSKSRSDLGGGTGLRRVALTDDLAAAQVAHHFVHVTVDDLSLSLEAVEIRGSIFDELELTR